MGMRDMNDVKKHPAATPLHRILQPPHWPRPKGYANGIMAEGRLVFTGGLVGWNEEGVFPEGFVADEIRMALGSVDRDVVVGKVSKTRLVEVEEVEEPQVIRRGEPMNGMIPVPIPRRRLAPEHPLGPAAAARAHRARTPRSVGIRARPSVGRVRATRAHREPARPRRPDRG